MTTYDHSDDPDLRRQATFDRDRVARELAALGEAPPDAAELHWAQAGDDVADEGVATTHALFRVAAGHPGHSGPIEALSSLERRRVWKRLAGRLERQHRGATGGGGGDTGRRVLAMLAMAAAVVLVARSTLVGQVPSASGVETSRAAAEALGAQARAGLDVLGGEVDGARARALADAHAMRLRGDREGT
jgi:hypothetical protein